MTPEQIGYKGPQDFLTATDLAIERLLRESITRQFPDDALLGEEQGGSIGDDTWVMDPIDGTANFARGIPHFCVVLAFVSQQQTRFGIIYDPIHDELFVARQGLGATLNGVPPGWRRRPISALPIWSWAESRGARLHSTCRRSVSCWTGR